MLNYRIISAKLFGGLIFDHRHKLFWFGLEKIESTIGKLRKEWIWAERYFVVEWGGLGWKALTLTKTLNERLESRSRRCTCEGVVGSVDVSGENKTRERAEAHVRCMRCVIADMGVGPTPQQQPYTICIPCLVAVWWCIASSHPISLFPFPSYQLHLLSFSFTHPPHLISTLNSPHSLMSNFIFVHILILIIFHTFELYSI